MQLIGLWDISYHCPRWLVMDREDWVPKPFKFNNEWFQHSEFSLFVEREWKDLRIHGRGDYVLKEKLRRLKSKLIWWNKNVFGIHDLKIEDSVKEINVIDDLDRIEDNNLETRRIANRKMWSNLKIRENMLIQKARVRWLNDGDINSKYFHKIMKKGMKRNYIGLISTDRGVIITAKEVLCHFEAKFKENDFNRPILEGNVCNSLNHEDKVYVESIFEEDEIREAIWCSDGFKSPGSDEYSILFFQKCWEVIKMEVLACFRDFYTDALMSKSIISLFLALIPKSNNQLDLDDYRPICLVGSVLKIISKVLAGRLKRVIGIVISKNQSAFVPGKQLLDGVVMANEMVDLATKDKK